MDSIGLPLSYSHSHSKVQRVLRRAVQVTACMAVGVLFVSIVQGASSGAILLAAVLLLAGSYIAKIKVVGHGRNALLFGFLSTVCAVLIYYQLNLYLSNSLEQGSSAENISLTGAAKPGYWLAVISAWLTAWLCVDHLASIDTLSRVKNSFLSVLTPIIFGVWLLLLWEFITSLIRYPY